MPRTGEIGRARWFARRLKVVLLVLLAGLIFAPESDARSKRGKKKRLKPKVTVVRTNTNAKPGTKSSILQPTARKGSISVLGHPERLKTLVRNLGLPIGEDAVMRNDAARIISRFEQSSLGDRKDQIHLNRVTDMLRKDRETLVRKDADGRTLLHQAAFAGYSRTAVHLLGNGADPSSRDHGGATPAELARRAGHNALAEAIEAALPGK